MSVHVADDDTWGEIKKGGATAAAKDATYHIIYAYLDAVIREVDVVAWMTGTKL
jgi:hypothetical protein